MLPIKTLMSVAEEQWKATAFFVLESQSRKEKNKSVVEVDCTSKSNKLSMFLFTTEAVCFACSVIKQFKQKKRENFLSQCFFLQCAVAWHTFNFKCLFFFSKLPGTENTVTVLNECHELGWGEIFRHFF